MFTRLSNRILFPIIMFVTMMFGCGSFNHAQTEQKEATTREIQTDYSGRYFQKNGQPFFFIGYYDWAPPVKGQKIDSKVTLKKLIDLSACYDLNYLRVSLGINRCIDNDVPFKYIHGKYDLSRWEHAFWKGLKYHIKYAEQKGVNVHIALFDGVNIRSGKGWWRYPNSFWNRKRQTQNFYGQIDVNENGWADSPHDFYRIDSFIRRKGIGKYQKKLIDKTIAETAKFSNVFYEVGNELLGGPEKWNYAVIKYIKSLTDKAVSVNLNPPRWADNKASNANGFSTHKPDNSLQIKKWITQHVGQGVPVWCDPDGGEMQMGHVDDNRRAAWYSLVGGAAGYGGFQNDVRNGSPDTTKLRYYQNLMIFLSMTDIPFWKMTPQQSLISNPSENSVMTKEGAWYLAYVRDDASVKINLVPGSYKFIIYNPKTRQFISEDAIPDWDGGRKTFNRPWGDDWVVYVYGDKEDYQNK